MHRHSILGMVTAAAITISGSALAQTLESIQQTSTELDSVLEYDSLNMNIYSDHDPSENLFPIDNNIPDERRQGNVVDSTVVVIVVDGYPLPLTDVPLSQWFAPYVRDTAERGLISGYRSTDGTPLGLYGPADSVTVEQLAKLAAEAAGISVESCSGDILNSGAEGRWSAQYILCAEEYKWAVFSDGSVDITRPATRAEVVATVLQAFSQKIAPRKGGVFDDVDSSTEFAAAIESAAADGLISGYKTPEGNPTGLFGPTDSVNRAEAAKIFSLAFQLY